MSRLGLGFVLGFGLPLKFDTVLSYGSGVAGGEVGGGARDGVTVRWG